MKSQPASRIQCPTSPLDHGQWAGPLKRVSIDLDDPGKSEVPWLFPTIIPAGVIGVLAGSPKSGKSTLIAQMAVSIVSGQPFLGVQSSEAQGVVLLSLEDGATSISRRIAGAIQQYPGEDQRHIKALVDHQLYVLGRSDHPMDGPFSELLGAIDTFLCSMRKEGIKPGLLAIDTLSCVVKGDENSSETFRDVMAACRNFAERWCVTIIFLHHLRKTPTGDSRSRTTPVPAIELLRGSSAIVASARFVLTLMPRPGSGGTWNATSCQRADLQLAAHNDGSIGEPIHLQMTPSGMWEIDDAPEVSEIRGDSILSKPKRMSKRDIVLTVLADSQDKSSTGPEGRVKALAVFAEDANPGAGLRSALRDLRQRDFVDDQDRVTLRGKAHIKQFP